MGGSGLAYVGSKFRPRSAYHVERDIRDRYKASSSCLLRLNGIGRCHALAVPNKQQN